MTTSSGSDAFPGGDKQMPIAIVGVGGRFPGDASNPDKLWDLLAAGRSARTTIPKDRYNADAFYHPHAERAGAQNFQTAHFMERDPEAFDAPFFQLTPNEVKAMDPQQRMCLEVAYEALENAGIPMENVIKTQTACFTGCFTADYKDMMSHDVDNLPAYFPTGVAPSCLSNRVSWFYDLRGPSMTVDTACSSSLIALHLACQAIRSGEADMSLVGGVNFMCNPEYNYTMSALHFLTPDGKCQSFDSKGNGYARGEGCAFLVIKPLEQALKDNDTIRAVIRGTGANQDGKTPGITLPSTEAQSALIRSTYARAGLDLADTGYFEAHGTGTAAGDPIETAALGETIGKARPADRPLWVGSIKANIGHLEGASGLAGLTKALYVLEKGEIPPQVWLETLNPRIKADAWNLAFPRELTPWPYEGLRRVSINSFGFGGANAHCILDDAYHYLQLRGLKGKHNTIVASSGASTPSVMSDDSGVSMSSSPWAIEGAADPFDNVLASADKLRQAAPKLLVVSSHEQSGIARATVTLQSYLETKKEITTSTEHDQMFSDLAYTTGARRSVLPWKTYAVASSVEDALGNLPEMPKPARNTKAPKLGFVFTGQGAQHASMGRELWAYPVFAESLKRADAHLSILGCPWSAIEELWKDGAASNINRAEFSQPLCTAVQIGLVDLLASFGIRPAAVVGHSSGEIAAAYAKGSITHEDALLISYHRGRLSSKIQEIAPQHKGSMMAAGLTENAANQYLARVTDGKAAVACINSLTSVTLSGDESAIDQLHTLLQADGVFARKLQVETAYHSFHMKAISKQYLRSMVGLSPQPERPGMARMFSTVTGALADSSDFGAQYWVQNMLSPVRFADGVEQLISFSESKRRRANAKPFVEAFIEIGPHGALQGPVKQILGDRIEHCEVLSALTRGKDCARTTIGIVGRLFQLGYPVDLESVNNPGKKDQTVLTDMLPYPWNHENKYWCESAWAAGYRFRKQPRNDLLGTLMPANNDEQLVWRHHFRLSENPWVEDHSVHNTLIYPAAGMMAMALEAAAYSADQSRKVSGYELKDVVVGKALIVPRDEDGVETMLHLSPWRAGSQANAADWNEFMIYSRPGKEAWSLNCSGLLRIVYKQTERNPVFQDEIALQNSHHRMRYQQAKVESTTPQSSESFYDHQHKIGLQLGVTFCNLKEINKGDGQSACMVTIPDMATTMPMNYITKHVIHPCTLDAIIQTLLPTVEGRYESLRTAAIPTFIERLFVSADIPASPGVKLQTYSLAGYTGLTEAEACVYASTEGWEKPLVVIERIRATRLASLTNASDGGATAQSIRNITGEFVWEKSISNMTSNQIRDHCDERTRNVHDRDSTPASHLERAAIIFARRAVAVYPEGVTSTLPTDRHELHSTLQTLSRLPDPSGSPLDDDAFLAYVQKSSACGGLLCGLGKALPDILQGQAVPQGFLSQEGNHETSSALRPGLLRAHAQLEVFLSLMGHERPDLKILELSCQNPLIGQSVIKALTSRAGATPWFKLFTCTGIPQEPSKEVAELLAALPATTEYKQLDCSKPLTQQGFKAGTYDLILASDLTQYYGSVQDSIKAAQQLLKPGGKLLLGEMSPKSSWYPLIVGVLNDGTFRDTYNDDAWEQLLQSAGLTSDELVLGELDTTAFHQFRFRTATLPREEVPELPTEVLLIESDSATDDALALADDVTRALRQKGVKVSSTGLSGVREHLSKDKACIMLAESESPILFDLKPEQFHDVRYLAMNAQSTVWITRGGALDCKNPKAGLITGLARTIRQESIGTKISTLDLDPKTVIDARGNVAAVLAVLRAQSLDDADSEYALRAGTLMTQRIHLHKGGNELIATFHGDSKPEPGLLKQEGRALMLTVETPGMLDSLYFANDTAHSNPLGDSEVEIEVKGAGLNFMDIMVAMGQIQEPAIGLEASGVVTRVGHGVTKFKAGDRLMTWSLGCFSNYVRNHESMFQVIPDTMDFAKAASLPMIYCTAYQSLVEEARLEPGEKILIHAASGGVGQAAIMIAQHIGAEIFVTVGTQAKKTHVMRQYGIPEDHIFNSRDLGFVNGIRRMTNGQGVDVILNSLAGEALRESWSCLAWFGRFIELGKKDITGNTGLEMAPFLRNQSFHAVNVIGTLRASIPRAARMFERTMRFFERASCSPVQPVTVMGFDQVEAGFRALQSGKNIGKIVFAAEDTAIINAIPDKVRHAKLSSSVTYVLSGGLGGLGRSLSKWMVEHGAQNLAFLSRSGSSKPSAQAQIDELLELGINAKAYVCDIGNASNVQSVVEQITSEMPPIYGVIQAAMSLADAAYENMTPEQWSLSVNPKAAGTWNLHRYMPKELDFFVMLASSSGAAGNPGQANYAAGNTFQDALAHHRRSKGLTAVAVDVGPVLGSGHVAENTKLIDSLAAQGYTALYEEEFVGLIQAAITGITVTGEPTPAQLVTGFTTGGLCAANEREIPNYLLDPKLRHLVLVDAVGSGGEDAGTAGLGTQLSAVTSISAGADLVAAALAAKLAKLMMVPSDDIDVGKPISTYGVDSLTAVEIRTWCFREIQSDISIFDIMTNIPISVLARSMASKSKLVDKDVVAADA